MGTKVKIHYPTVTPDGHRQIKNTEVDTGNCIPFHPYWKSLLTHDMSPAGDRWVEFWLNRMGIRLDGRLSFSQSRLIAIETRYYGIRVMANVTKPVTAQRLDRSDGVFYMLSFGDISIHKSDTVNISLWSTMLPLEGSDVADMVALISMVGQQSWPPANRTGEP